MTAWTPKEKPLDSALRERLHLRGKATGSLWFVRSVIQSIDSVSRTVSGQPFFALRESEDLLRQIAGLKGPELVHALLDQNGGTRIEPHGVDNIPTSGPVIIVATHPTGLFDFFAHADTLLGLRPDLKVVANQETEKFLGADLIVPVQIDKENRAMSGTMTRRGMEQHLRDDGALLIFGSGRVPHQVQGRLVEPDWRGGATRVSKSCAVPIVPAALATRNSKTYYRIRSFAQTISGGNDSFGAMIGSLRYAAELMDKLGGAFDVHYGSPMPAGTAPAVIQKAAETLVPGLYQDHGATPGPGKDQSSNNSG